MKKVDVSIIIPVYNEESYLQTFFDNLKLEISAKSTEVIFIDDGSTDYSGRILNQLANDYPYVKIITLDKNYGKQIAVTAGMKHSIGESIIIMSIKDGAPYSQIQNMLVAKNLGADIVRGYYVKNHSFWRFLKGMFFKFFAKLFGVKNAIVDTPDVELYSRRVVDVINGMPGKNMTLRRTNCFFGYKIEEFEFEPRFYSEQDKQEAKKIKEKYSAQRKTENAGQIKKVKKKLYANSLWASYGFFVLFGLFLLLFLILLIIKVPKIWLIFDVILMCFCVIVSISFLTRSYIIKRLGLIISLKPGEELYETKSLINF